eukprot:205352-Chlamydomonas_euryale.AAC.1
MKLVGSASNMKLMGSANIGRRYGQTSDVVRACIAVLLIFKHGVYDRHVDEFFSMTTCVTADGGNDATDLLTIRSNPAQRRDRSLDGPVEPCAAP